MYTKEPILMPDTGRRKPNDLPNGLWEVALLYGFVFDQQDVEDWMRESAASRTDADSIPKEDNEDA